MTHLASQPVASEAPNMITPRFLLRVGGLPFNVLNALRFERTMQWQESVLALEQQLFQRKDRLVDILHEAVNRYKEDIALRRTIINSKRDIFNFHLPRGVAQARTIEPLLAGEERALLHAWLNLWESYQQELARGTDIIAQEFQEKRACLKHTFSTPDFRKGVLLSSPVLARAVDGYLTSENAHLNREARTVERSLFEYLLRTAAKTSPFSTFTPVGIGTWENRQDTASDDIVVEMPSIEKQSFTRLNIIILSRLSAHILTSSPIRPALSVRVTNGWRWRNGRIQYIRRKPLIDAINYQGAIQHDLVQEHTIQLPTNTILDELLAMMGDGQDRRLDDVISLICERLAQPQAAPVVEKYLQHLLRLGFLIVPALQVDIHHPRPLDAYCQKLATFGLPQTDALASCLTTIASLVDSYAHASLEERAAILERVQHLLQQATTFLGTAQQTLQIPRTLLYEDTALTPTRLAIQQEHWQEILANVHELLQILPIFNARLPQRITMRGYFQARYGAGKRCDDFFTFADAFNNDFLRLFYQNDRATGAFDQEGNFKGLLNYFEQPEIKQLNEARLLSAEYVGQAYRTLPSESTELILGEHFFQSLVPLVPEEVKDLLSCLLFSQFARVNNEALLVINHIYAGFTLMFSRFAHCFAHDQRLAMLETLRNTLHELQPAGAVFAELKGGYDATNLNLHPTVTSYELVCPGELSSRPLGEQIPLEDLFIQDDVQTGRLALYSKRLGKEVIPLYLGFLTPAVLPEIQQILLNFSYFTNSSLDLWSGTKIVEADAPQVHYPRLRYKQLVLQRETWRIHASLLPRREKGQSDASFLLALTRWQRELCLPSRVFLTIEATADQANSEKSGASSKGSKAALPPPSYKPMYLDFTNLFSIQLLETVAQNTNSTLVFTEMLPHSDQLWFKHDGQAYVSEFGLEISQARRADHE